MSILVFRVECSLDGGETWIVEDFKKRQEELTPLGKLYSWALWEIPIENFDPATCEEVSLYAY